MPYQTPDWAHPLAPYNPALERVRAAAPSPLGAIPGTHPRLPSGDVRGGVAGALLALLALGAFWLFVIGLVLVGVRAAFANANAVPVKQAALREALGYAPNEAFVFDTTTWGFGALEFSVDEAIGLPDIPTVEPGIAPPRASVVRLQVQSLLDSRDGIIRNFAGTKSPTVSQVYSWAFSAAGDAGLSRPPCVSPDSAGRALLDWTGEYSCLTESQLVLLAPRVADMALWAKPDWPMVHWLQKLHGSAGLPLVINAAWAKARTEDETGSALPSVLRMDVLYLFVLPKDPNWEAPPVDPAVP